MGLLFRIVAMVALLASLAARADDEPTGILRVEASQPGARVYLDRVEIGAAPIVRYVPVGPHLVRVVADGFDPYVRKVTVAADQTAAVEARLVPGGGTVEFQVDAPKATLILDGRERWPLPVRLRDLPPGEHAWRIEAPGHEPVEGSFEFVPGHNLLFVETLPSSAGIVVVTTRPPGASVWLDGEPAGSTPLRLEGVAPGAHALRVEAEGYATVFRAFDNTDGQRVELPIRLNRRGAALVVKTGREDAELRVDGARVATGARVRLPAVARGTHRFEVVAPGAAPASGRFTIPDGGRLVLQAALDAEDSALVEVPPPWERWTFWAAAGAVAAGGAAGGVLAWRASRPTPVPEGDVVVNLP